MATLAEQMQGERMARVALSMIAEPNDADHAAGAAAALAASAALDADGLNPVVY